VLHLQDLISDLQRRLLDAFLVAVTKRPHTLLLRFLQNARHRVDALVQILDRGTERQPDEVMARRIEQVPPVRGIDIKEDAWDDDGLFFEEFFEECQPVIQGTRQLFQIKPDVEGSLRGDIHFQV